MGSSLRNRVMALALSVLTAVTTCAGAVPAWAEDVQADSTASSSVEQAAETAVVNVKIDSAGGSVVVGNGSDQETVRMQDDGTIKTTDAEGNETVAAVDETHPYAVTLTETKGAVVPVTATASDGYDVSTYTVTIDGGSEDTGFVSGGTFSYSLTADRNKTVEIGFAKKAGAETQTQAQAQPEAEAPASQPEAVTSAKAGEKVDTSAYDGMDFSSARLLVGTGDASVVTGDRDNILSSYDGLYLIQYPDAQAAKEAYAGYVRTADFVDIDNASLSAADGADIADVTAENAMTESSNPLAELADAPSGKAKKGTIALIDTGATRGGSVAEAVSMLGDDASDDNGHGTQMVGYITEEDPDARILSIKALDANGNGTPSSVTAAIKYAIEKKVSVINLSLSGTRTADASAVEEAVKEAVRAGITVIGAAGNNGNNAKYYIPGGIGDAVIAGAADSEGNRLPSSNFGETVDYYVVSGSTSEAAARLSGIFSANGKIEADNKTVFLPGTTNGSESGEPSDHTEGIHVAFNPPGAQKIGNRVLTITGYASHVSYSSYGYGTWDTNIQRVRVDGSSTPYNGQIFDGICAQPQFGSNAINTRMDLYTLAGNEALENKIKKVLYYGYHQPGASQGIARISSNEGAQQIITHTAVSYLQAHNSQDADNGWATQLNQAGQDATRRYLSIIDSLPTPGGVDLYYAQLDAVNTQLLYFIAVNPHVYFRLHKLEQSGCGSTQGATYELWKDAPKGQGGKGTGIALTIGSDGYSQTVEIEAGHDYWIHESSAPSNGNYLLDGSWHKISASQVAGHTDRNNPAIVDTTDAPKTYVYLTKSSANTDVTHNNRCYSLNGATFELKNTGTGNTYTLTTDANGNTPTIQVETGTYHVTETAAPYGYQKNTNIPDITVTNDNVKSNAYHIQVQDAPGVDPVPLLLQKRDAETGKGTPQGAGSLAGAQYTVKYYDVQNADEDSLKDETPLRTWVLATNVNGAVRFLDKNKVSGDDFYLNDGVAGMPIGTILMQETKAPNGYQLNDEVYVVHFNPDGNGNVTADVNAVYADNDAADQVKALEAPQRGGLNFLKYDTENRPMAGVPFVITSETTGESHVVIADENGRVNTEANKHSNNTNGNDSLVRKTAEGGYVCDDPSKLDADAGVWFGEAAADDSRMALLFDKYTIDEVFVKDINYGKNISNKRKNDTKENKAGSILGVVIDTNGKNVSLDPEVWENPDVTLGTAAKNADVDSKEIALTDTATVVDTVSYGNLTPGDSYTLKGKLVDKNNPSVSVAEAETTFTPDKKDGTVDVTFHFDSSSLEGKTLVAFEYLHWKGIEIAKHEEAGDTAQTVYVPKLRTTLTDKAVEDEVGVKAKDDTLVDTVRYWNLAPHENYIIKGQLVQKSTGKVLAATQSEEFSVRKNSMDGTKDVTFKFDSTGLAGETVVAYEKLYLVPEDGDLYELDKHEDIEDIDQSVYFPKIGTTAADGKTHDHVGTSGKKETLVDTVKLSNIVVGKKYTVHGTLMNKTTEEPILLADGRQMIVEGTVTFDENGEGTTEFDKTKSTIPGSVSNAKGVLDAKNGNKTVNGSVDLTFTFDSSVLEGKTVVAFEDLLHKDIEVDTHHEITDEGQSVHYPKVGTSAKDGATQDAVGTVGTKTTLVDTVKLENLVPGMTYTVNGILKDQTSGSDFTVDGKTVTQGAEITVNADGTITAKNGEKVTAEFNKEQNRVDGTVELTFTFDSSALSGKSVVAFEDLGHNDITVAVHHDIHDDGQTVHYPEIHTTAVDKTTGDHVGSIFGALINGIRKMFGQTDADGNGIPDDRQQNIVDTVTLANLVPGKSYVVSGKLMDADTGKAVVIDGKEVTSSTVITASENGISSSNGCKTVFDNFDKVNHDVDGSVDLAFTLDSSKIQGVKTVVFERLYHADGFTPDTETPDWEDDTTLVNRHEDKDDEGQSVSEVSVHTTAVDMATGNDQGAVPNSHVKESVIEDTVELAKLVPGMDYQIRGRLVDLTDSDFENGKVVYLKLDGSATDNIDEAVTALDNFKAEASEETRKLQLTINGSLVQGKDVTVFEDILHNGVVISSHPAKDTPETWDKDEFKSQTVHYMTGKTNATDGVEGIHSTVADGTRTIEDKVYFQNLLVGKTYSVEGTLHDKTTGEALTDEGAARKVTFTASEDLTEAAYDSDSTGETGTPAKVSDLKVTEHFDGTKTISGYVTLTFTVDASELAGQTLVAFEKFTNEGREIFVHEDLEDLPQTIKIPKIGTTAKAGELDETALYNEDGTPKEITITDTVSYENLWTKELLDKLHEEGLAITDNGTVIASDHTPVYDINETGEYTMTGKLMDKATGKALTDVNGNEYETSVHFVPDAENGTVDVTFTLNAADFIDKDGSCILNGKSIVVFEDLYQVPEDGETSEDNHTAVHHDIDDQGQDIRFPKGQTHATDYTDGALTQEELSALTQEDLAKIAADHESEVTIDSHEAEATGTMKILDMVSYSNLHAATEYTVTGTLQVVTERDENGKAVKWEPALDDEGKEVTQAVTFTTPEDEDGQDSVSGYVPVLFSFKGVNLAGKTTVAFEKFTREGQDVMVHHDITDKPQTDYIPAIHTNATDSVTGNHNGVVDGKGYIIDEVSYENLQKGITYKLGAQLMDKDSSKAFGSAVEGTFVAGMDGQFITPDGTAISTMDDMRKALKDNSEPETVKDTKETKQETTKETTKETTGETAEPSVEVTTAEVGNGIAKGNYVVTANEWKDGNWGFVHVFDKDPEDGGKLVNAVILTGDSNVISLTDGEFVQYFNVNLHKNSKVEVSGIDAEKIEENYNADMEEIAGLEKDTAGDTEKTDESSAGTTGKTVETDVTVSADSQGENVENGNDRVSGSVYVVIPVDASKLGGHTLVAFEKLYTNPENGTPKEIAHHEDINDEDQSVHYIDVHTNATDKKDGDKTLATSGTVTVNDKVSFKNLIPGKKYKVAGTLMDKKTGKPLTVNGKTVASENTFTPNAADGSINMEFTFDVTAVASGDYVVFEKLYDSESGAEIAKHEDINDKSQTVTVPARPEIQTSDRPISPVLPVAAGAAVVAIIAAVLFGRKRKTDK